MKRGFLAVALALVVTASGLPVGAQTASVAELERALQGTWLVTFEGQQRTRQLVIRGVRAEGDRFVLDSLWGWSDVNPQPASGTARLENGVVSLEVITVTKAEVTARSTGEGHLAGTYTIPKPATFTIRLERISQATEPRVVSNRPTPIMESGQAVTPALLEQFLYGTWLVTVGTQTRTRTMEIRTVREEGDRFVAEAVYGWTGGRPVPAPMTVKVEHGIVALDVVTAAGSRITARSAAPDRFVGSFTGPDGRESRVRLVLTGNEVRTAPAAAKIKDLTVVYVSAANCPTCKSWEGNASTNPKWAANSKAAFLAVPEVKAAKFRQIDTANYMNTGRAEDWPEDLHWVLGATYVVSGTPRFIVIADGKVMLNARRAQIESKVLPKLRELAAKKE